MIMTEHIDPIPDDLPACQELLRTLLMRLHDLERQLDEFVATTEEMQRSYACLKEEHLVLKRMLFGPRRERLAEAPGSNISSMTVHRRPRPMNQPLPRRTRNRRRVNGKRDTVVAKSPTICPARTSPMTSPRRNGYVTAAARSRGSART